MLLLPHGKEEASVLEGFSPNALLWIANEVVLETDAISGKEALELSLTGAQAAEDEEVIKGDGELIGLDLEGG